LRQINGPGAGCAQALASGLPSAAAGGRGRYACTAKCKAMTALDVLTLDASDDSTATNPAGLVQLR
jgi:hypothetical protein